MPALDIGGTRVEFLEQGRGEPVLLLHSSASSSGQWRSLIDSLRDRYRVFAPDFYGCGGTGNWRGGCFTLADDAEIARALLNREGGRAHLVGHSYGGTVALHLARRYSHAVRSLTLIEPVAFQLLRDDDSFNAAFSEIRAVAERLRRAFTDGDSQGGMARFVD